MDVGTLTRKMDAGQLSALDLTRLCVARIKERNLRLHAVETLLEEQALASAEAADAARADGRKNGPLHGIPVLIKELIDIAGLETLHGSRCYGASVAVRSAPLVQRLEAAGAIILGTTHMVEFAMGSWGTNEARGTPLNPRGGTKDWYAGGSSSGSAVAVAAGLVPLAIGSDTGGSIRIPATICGVHGFKPSRGLIPTEGVAPLAATFDTIGPLGNSIADLRLACEVMAGRSFAPDRALSRNLTIAVVSAEDLVPCAPEVLDMRERLMMRLSALGHRVVPITLPASLPRLQELNGTIVAFEAWQHFHQQASDPSSPMDPHVRKRVLAGKDVDETKYRALLDEIAEMTKSFAQAQADVDAILLPGTPIPAAGLETVDQDEIPLSRYTRMANTLDLCAIAMPVGATPEGAPLGIQLCAPWGHDSRLLAVAEKLEPDFSDLYVPLATS